MSHPTEPGPSAQVQTPTHPVAFGSTPRPFPNAKHPRTRPPASGARSRMGSSPRCGRDREPPGGFHVVVALGTRGCTHRSYYGVGGSNPFAGSSCPIIHRSLSLAPGTRFGADHRPDRRWRDGRGPSRDQFEAVGGDQGAAASVAGDGIAPLASAKPSPRGLVLTSRSTDSRRHRRHGTGDGTGRGRGPVAAHCARRGSTRRSPAHREADRRCARSRASRASSIAI